MHAFGKNLLQNVKNQLMNLSTLDWSLIFGFFAITLFIGIWVSKKSGESSADFFLSGRSMPWWLLGISMVATTFSADTPNLVTDIVRKNGVAGNWVWWAFLLTGMLTVFVYAKLWRRSGILTDLEFYELRYSGKPAAFLRGFRAIYLGVFFNIMIMATVCLAAIKIGGAMMGLSPGETILIASVVTVIYSTLGGLRGVILTDFFQFGIAMVGSIWAVFVVLNHPEIEVEGLSGLLNHPNVADKLNIIPDFNNWNLFLTLMIIPLAVQWWSVWYPGSEPGGGGYVAQRMLAAKNERHAMGATLLYNVAHYAFRPWPWILIALVSLVVFPMKLEQVDNRSALSITQDSKDFLDQNTDATYFPKLIENLDSKMAEAEGDAQKADYGRLKNLVDQNQDSYEIKSLAYIFAEKNFDKDANTWKDVENWSDPLADESLVYLQIANPQLPINKLGHDLAYPSMMNYLPSGLLGLVLASLIAAFMSTISTHLNWGSSYVVNDWYKRFRNPDASEKELVRVGRISTVLLMIAAALFALALSNALQAFNILLQIGAGTGLLFILRWFWWRINAYSEIAAMVISFVIALYFEFVHSGLLGFEALEDYQKLLSGVVLTTIGWVIVTYQTAPTDQKTLLSFYKLIRPAKGGWKPVLAKAEANDEIHSGEINEGQLPLEILGMVTGCFTVYSALFATGYWIYGNTTLAIIATSIAVVGTLGLINIWGRLKN